MTTVVVASTALLLAWFFVRTDTKDRPKSKGLRSNVFPVAVFLYVLLLRAYFDISHWQILVVLLGAAAGYGLYAAYSVMGRRLGPKNAKRQKRKLT